MNYHKSIDTLPYWNFLQIRKHNDLRYLFALDNYLDLSKIKVNEDHLAAFDVIMTEYNNELIKREKGAYIFDIEKQIGELESERLIAQLCLSQIKIFKDKPEYKEVMQRYIDELENLGYEYNGNLDALEGKIDSIINEIDDLEITRSSVFNNSDNATPERIINEIEKYRKVAIDITKVSVKQYLTYESDYIEYVSNLNKKK